MFRSLRGTPRHDGRRLALAVALLLAGVTLVACGGNDNSSGSSEAGTGSAGSATVKAGDLPGFGTVLVTGSGDTVYVHTGDPKGGSDCSGKCAREYEPLEPKEGLSAGPGADQALLSSFKRDDGTEQVLYADKALYTYSGQGSVTGAGVESYGGTWLLIEPSGDEIKKTDTGGY